MLVVRDEQRMKAEQVLHHVHDEIRIARAAHRHDAVVNRPRLYAILGRDPAEPLEPLPPVERVLLFVNAAAAAHAGVVEGDVERMVGGIEAARAVLQMTSSGMYRNRS